MAREWLDRGRNALSPFDALRDFWAGFNRLYGHNARPVRERIRAYLLANFRTDEAAAILASHVPELACLTKRPILDMRGNGRDTALDRETYFQSANAVEKLISIFMIVYQIRCNLEHGQKLPSSVEDSQFCAAGAAIVANVLEKCA